MPMRRTAPALAVALAALLALGPPGPGGARAAPATPAQRAVPGDLSGDGFADLAVGVPGEDLGAFDDNGGAVQVLYGSAGGLEPGGELFVQGRGGVGGTREPDDQFGAALAKGDFNGDGLADLAVGVPGENVGAAGNAGAVTVLVGSPAGLRTSGGQTLFQGGNGVAGAAEVSDAFGTSVAAGTLGGDGLAELAAGAPGETVHGVPGTGAVSVFRGPPGGLGGERLLFQGTAGIPGSPERGDWFGSTLAPADTDGAGRWDLAVGVPGEDLGHAEDAGAVNLLTGSVSGPGGGRLVLQANPEDRDGFGSAIAGGSFPLDVDGDGRSDLAVGAPTETVGGTGGAGAVSVYPASDSGVLAPGPVLTQGGGLAGTPEVADLAGAALA
jgi:hypothetical protein